MCQEGLAYLGERFAPRQSGPPLSAAPVKWRPLVEMFVTEQNAAKCCPAMKMTMTPSLSMKTKMVALVATLTG